MKQPKTCGWPKKNRNKKEFYKKGFYITEYTFLFC